MTRKPTREHDKLAPTPTAQCAEAVTSLTSVVGGRVAPAREPARPRPVRTTAPTGGPAPPVARGRRDTRPLCASCAQRNECPSARDDGGVCPLEADAYAELTRPERIPGVLRDVLRAELRTFFRAKRLEARSGGKIDGEASKLAQALFKQVECYLDVCQRVNAQSPGRARDAEVGPQPVFPNLTAALEASAEGLFSEVPDADARRRLRSEYLQALAREDAVLRQVQEELPRTE
jgi:hypothetical protein